ncbi:MAG TPA: hypothetical protein PKY12_13405 [Catalimonadaceae bacterium]|nr:hypothetical protein [Catalimonadaceae bacterium]
MAKIQISASIDEDVRNKVNELADKEKRSFSQQVNYMLEKAVNTEKSKTK